jgi:hypothetical protein
VVKQEALTAFPRERLGSTSRRACHCPSWDSVGVDLVWLTSRVPPGVLTADKKGMRNSHAATAFAAFAAGLTAAAALRRLAGHRRPVTAAASAAASPSVESGPDLDAVVLPFVRPVVAGPMPEQPESPGRCGDSGGRTKGGAPCGARTSAGARCRHHRLAA